jgi:MoxR-like ATPase
MPAIVDLDEIDRADPDLQYVAMYEVLSKNVGGTRHFLLITKAFMGQNIYTLSEEYRDGEYHLPLSSVEQVADLAGNILYSRLIERVP